MVKRISARLRKSTGTLAGLAVLYAGFLIVASWARPSDAAGLSAMPWEEGEARRTWGIALAHYAASLKLYLTALVAVGGFGVPMGIFCGGIRSGLFRGVAGLLSMVLASAPALFLTYLCFYACVQLLEVPVLRSIDGETEGAAGGNPGGRALTGLWFVLLPAGVLSIPGIGRVAGEIRKAVSESMKGPSMVALTSRGLSRRRRLYRYALPASWWAVFRSLREVLPAIIGGSLVVEWIFLYPGLGSRCFAAVREGDYHLLFVAALLLALTVFVVRSVLGILETIFLEEEEATG